MPAKAFVGSTLKILYGDNKTRPLFICFLNFLLLSLWLDSKRLFIKP